MRLALAAIGVFALCAASPHHAGPPHGPGGQHGSAAHHAPVMVRAQALAGNGQSGHAYASPAATLYVTDFPQELVVRVTGVPPGEDKRLVRFRCVTKGCKLAPAENGENVERVDAAAYDVTIVRDRASVRIAVAGPSATAIYTITAHPVISEGEHAVGTTFTLTTR